MNRFVWERLLMMSDLPQEDRFKLLALGMFMDGETGDGARPGAANLAMFGHHEETWKQLLRRTVSAGWLIMRERGGSRKGPNGTRIRKASKYAASVPAEVHDRRKEILDKPPFRAAKKAPDSTKEAREQPADDETALPSSDGASAKEAQGTSFDAKPPVDNPSAPAYEGSPPDYEGSAEKLPSTSTKEAKDPTKEASGVYEGSADGLRRKRNDASPSISPPSTTSTSKIRSDRSARYEVQDRKGVRWLIDNWPGVTEPIAAHIVQAVRLEAARYGSEIEHLVPYLKRMHEAGDLADYVSAAFDHFDRVEVEAAPNPEPPPHLHSVSGAASSSDATATQPSLLLHAVPDEQPADDPAIERDEDGIPAVTERETARAVFDRLNAERRAAAEATEARRRRAT